MWRYLKSLKTNTPNIWSEVSVRIALMLTVLVMHVMLPPYNQFITDKELQELKRPRRDLLTPPWVMVFLILFLPMLVLLIPCTLAKHNDDTIPALLAWSLACCITALITETGKLAVGRPRPDFFYRCFPNGKLQNDLRCTGNLKDINEGRKSFPSGHSSMSFSSLGFLSVWMCGKLGVLSRSRGHGMRVLACLFPLMTASMVAVSRYCENHHHWEDVFVGSIIGYTTTYFCYRQYYYPLNSPEHAGKPYEFTAETELYSSSEQVGCSDMKATKGCNIKNKYK